MHQQLLLEVALSVLRHDLRNKLASIRNASFYLRRKTQRGAPALFEEDPRVPQFFDLIDSELTAAETALAPRVSPAPGPAGVIDAARLIEGLAAELALPQGIGLAVDGSAPIAGDHAELALAAYCLIENAVDAVAPRGGRVAVRCAPRDDATTVIEVEDDGPGFDEAALAHAFDPFFTTRPDRLGLGLKIARRIALRGAGNIELGPGGRARLILPAGVNP